MPEILIIKSQDNPSVYSLTTGLLKYLMGMDEGGEEHENKCTTAHYTNIT